MLKDFAAACFLICVSAPAFPGVSFEDMTCDVLGGDGQITRYKNDVTWTYVAPVSGKLVTKQYDCDRLACIRAEKFSGSAVRIDHIDFQDDLTSMTSMRAIVALDGSDRTRAWLQTHSSIVCRPGR